MKRTEWSVGLRNKLSSLAMELDSATAIEDANMTEAERTKIKYWLSSAVKYIDKKIAIKKK
jgi:hypothetical protein